MTNLAERTTRLRFATSEEVRQRGKYRKIVVEARPQRCILKLAGMRQSVELPWEAIWSLANKIQVAAQRAEKKAKKAGKK